MARKKDKLAKECDLFVAYYRISPDGHNQRNLKSYGIDAQKEAVRRFADSPAKSILVVAAFEEVESGANSRRPQLIAAIECCRKTKATLLIAKLDRLSRNAAFLLNLRDSGVDFVCCDMPQADRFTVGILALVAEREREMISERTKAGLAAAKARGVVVGNPNWGPALKKAAVARIEALKPLWAEQLKAVREIRAAGIGTLTGIARCLNARGVRTARGGVWTATAVRNLLKRE
jgi:DNA invertase Pin-like site-specific DNA recombinase